MKSTVLLVVASIHLGGSYYNQTSLSSVLSTFEAQLTVPRQKEAEQIAPVSTAVPAPAAAPLLHADDTSEDTPADATLLPANVTSVDTSSTAVRLRTPPPEQPCHRTSWPTRAHLMFGRTKKFPSSHT